MYLYHAVPPNMVGTVLYPLNELKLHYPLAYAEHYRKYHGREKLTEQRIPLLNNCLWNDVLFMMAVSPQVTAPAFEGVFGRHWRIKFFRFEAAALDPRKMAVLHTGDIRSGRFEPFDVAQMARYQEFSPKTVQHWQGYKAANKRPFYAAYVPHVLYHGHLDTTGVPIVE